MENPSQLTYTTEQLFSLAPMVPVKTVPQVQKAATGSYIAASPIVEAPGAGCWSQNTWPIIICRALIIGGVCYYFYHKKQKNKEANQAN